jgi:hypothetical protein
MQIHPAALPVDLIHLALAVVLTTGLEGQQLRFPRERLKRGQQISYGSASLLRQRLSVVSQRAV